MLPALPTPLVALFCKNEPNSRRFWEFFTAHIRNHHTRRAYFQAASRFAVWCDERKLGLDTVQPFHVAAYIEQLLLTHSRPTVKQHLAALRVLFDWLVVGQVMTSNPAASVRGPRYSVKRGKTPVLAPEEVRTLLASIDTTSLLGLRDRALVAVMAYTFARVGAVQALRVRDYYIQGRRGWLRLQEKGGKVNEVPCHHHLEQYLDEYLDVASLRQQPDALFFPGFRNTRLTSNLLSQSNVHAMLQRRAIAAGIRTRISCHSFRATGITTYLLGGGRLEIAQQMAGHESSRTTGLYDRRDDRIAREEVERIRFE